MPDILSHEDAAKDAAMAHYHQYEAQMQELAKVKREFEMAQRHSITDAEWASVRTCLVPDICPQWAGEGNLDHVPHLTGTGATGAAQSSLPPSLPPSLPHRHTHTHRHNLTERSPFC